MEVYGVDLGTINCSVAKVAKNKNGEIIVETLKNKENKYSFRNIIQFKSPKDVVVGKDYFEIDETMIDNTIEAVKARLGEVGEIKFKINSEDVKLTPQFLTAIVLKHIKNSYSSNINKAVLTVPAFSSQNKRNAIIEAAEIANFDVIELIEEPSAAIMYHLFQKYKECPNDIFYFKEKKHILVFDFGGGTLDLSLVSVQLDNENNIIPKVELTSGDNGLGGKLIDLQFTEVIINYLYENHNDKFICDVKEHFKYYFDNFKYKNNLAFRSDVDLEVKNFIFSLVRELERVKIELSKKKISYINLGDKYEELEISREYFEEAIIVHSNIENYIINALQKFNTMNTSSIDEIILVGGSSQIPYIKTILEQKYSKQVKSIYSSKNYNYAVANGAAILAAIRNGINIEPFGMNSCSGVIAKNIFIRYENNDEKFISCGEKYPFDSMKKYSIKINFSLTPSINIKFIEKSIERDKQVSSLVNDINFYHPCFYTGETINIYLEVDEKGLFKFKAVHEETNEEIEFESEKEYSLSNFKIVEENKELKNIQLSD